MAAKEAGRSARTGPRTCFITSADQEPSRCRAGGPGPFGVERGARSLDRAGPEKKRARSGWGGSSGGAARPHVRAGFAVFARAPKGRDAGVQVVPEGAASSTPHPHTPFPCFNYRPSFLCRWSRHTVRSLFHNQLATALVSLPLRPLRQRLPRRRPSASARQYPAELHPCHRLRSQPTTHSNGTRLLTRLMSDASLDVPAT